MVEQLKTVDDEGRDPGQMDGVIATFLRPSKLQKGSFEDRQVFVASLMLRSKLETQRSRIVVKV